MFSSKVKSFLKIAFAVYAVNNFSLFVRDGFSRTPKGIDNPNIQEVMETNQYKYEYQGSDDEVLIDYLKLAHAITSKNIMYCRENWHEDNDDLLNGVGSCCEISKFTYSNFLYLIDKSNRRDLASKVRIANGEVSASDGGGGHVWLEVFSENEWKEYEPTSIDLSKDVEINPAAIDDLISDDEVFDLDCLDYNRTASWQYSFETGDTNLRPSVLGVMKSRGLSYLLYNTVKNNI